MTHDRGDAEDLVQEHRADQERPAETTRATEDVVMSRVPDGAIEAALDSLPTAFKVAVLLADVEGFTYEEIAARTGVATGTVMSRIHRGRKALRGSLHEHAVRQGLLVDAQ